MGKMTVYHGSYTTVVKPKIVKNTKDFVFDAEVTEGRVEKAKETIIFFTCSLIEYIARKTKNKRATVANALMEHWANVTRIMQVSLSRVHFQKTGDVKPSALAEISKKLNQCGIV